jgi:hypothetical protein
VKAALVLLALAVAAIGFTSIASGSVQGGSATERDQPQPAASPSGKLIVATPNPSDPLYRPPPAGHTQTPERPRYAASTTDQLLAGLKSDAFAVGAINELTSPGTPFYRANIKSAPTIGLPVLVPALLPSSHSEWLVPIEVDGAMVGVIEVTLDSSNRALAGAFTSWPGPFPHALTLEQARANASTASDPVQSIDLVWAQVSPLEGGPGSDLAPFYRAVRASGTAMYVFQNGNVVPASAVHPSR